MDEDNDGKELKRLRTVRKISLRALAKEIDISPTTLVRLERGEEPDMASARKIMPYTGRCACCGNAYLTATRHVSDEAVDDVAARLWKAESEDAGAPASVAIGRTPDAFREQSEDLKARWRKFARAALSAALAHTGKVPEPNSGVSYTASHLSDLLEQRDAFIVSKGLWAEFTASLQGAET